VVEAFCKSLEDTGLDDGGVAAARERWQELERA
jgi:hypothetical protein